MSNFTNCLYMAVFCLVLARLLGCVEPTHSWDVVMFPVMQVTLSIACCLFCIMSFKPKEKK